MSRYANVANIHNPDARYASDAAYYFWLANQAVRFIALPVNRASRKRTKMLVGYVAYALDHLSRDGAR